MSDIEVPSVVRGRIGISFAWTNPVTGYTILFVYVYGLDGDRNIAWGEILVYGKKDIDLITTHGLALLVVMQVKQPDAVGSAARQGGLRPSGVILSYEISVPDDVVA